MHITINHDTHSIHLQKDELEIILTEHGDTPNDRPQFNIDVNFYHIAQKMGRATRDKKPHIEYAERAANSMLDGIVAKLEGKYANSTKRSLPVDYADTLQSTSLEDIATAKLYAHRMVTPQNPSATLRNLAVDVGEALELFSSKAGMPMMTGQYRIWISCRLPTTPAPPITGAFSDHIPLASHPA